MKMQVMAGAGPSVIRVANVLPPPDRGAHRPQTLDLLGRPLVLVSRLLPEHGEVIPVLATIHYDD